MATLGQSLFGRDILSKLASVEYWQFVTAAKQRKVDIDNDRENDRRVTHDYAIGY